MKDVGKLANVSRNFRGNLRDVLGTSGDKKGTPLFRDIAGRTSARQFSGVALRKGKRSIERSIGQSFPPAGVTMTPAIRSDLTAAGTSLMNINNTTDRVLNRANKRTNRISRALGSTARFDD